MLIQSVIESNGCLIACLDSFPQVEIDYKAECNAGDTVESLGVPVKPITCGNGATGRQHFLHTLQRSDGTGACCELVRCRTVWSPTRK